MCCIFITYNKEILYTPKLYETAAFYMYVIMVWNEREVSSVGNSAVPPRQIVVATHP